MPAPAARAPALSMRGISKGFAGIAALSEVDFDCRFGEVHSICGENGAGKSTLMKILGGIYVADAGAIEIDGAPVVFAHPRQAQRAGISIVHQELSLLPHRTVAQNVLLGQEPSRFGIVDRKAMAARARDILEGIGSRIDPSALAGSLSTAEQQLVEIAKALSFDIRVLVMDEPTAALNESEAQRLLDLVRRLRDRGIAIVYVSHRMAEVMAIADRVTVLKDGRSVFTRPRAGLAISDIVGAMVGRPLADFYPPRREKPAGTPVLTVSGGANDELADIELTIGAGEIVGIAGLDGSGKEALARAVFGDAPFRTGTVRGPDGPLSLRSARDGVAARIGYLPGERKASGLALHQSVLDNARLTLRARAPAFSAPRGGAMSEAATTALLKRTDVRAADYRQEIVSLSGGNQQKAIIARWLALGPRLYVFVEPTRGIDVAAKAAIYETMRGLTEEGCAILMVSSDLQEIVGISDRILVMHEGRIAGELPAGAPERDIMSLAVGEPAPEARP